MGTVWPRCDWSTCAVTTCPSLVLYLGQSPFYVTSINRRQVCSQPELQRMNAMISGRVVFFQFSFSCWSPSLHADFMNFQMRYTSWTLEMQLCEFFWVSDITQNNILQRNKAHTIINFVHLHWMSKNHTNQM